MNREIKFRVVWNGEVSLYGFTLGELIEGVELEFKDGGTLPFKDIDWSEDKVAYMQYTGLKDKNGVEIYEGDVVVQYTVSGKEAQRGDVRWSKNETGFQIGDKECWRLGIYTGMYGKNCLEIIGNIYENPELIK